MANRYPMDPNSLISAIRGMNEQAQRLRSEGWTVSLKVADSGSRVWVEINQTNSCDPPVDEAEGR